MTQKTQRFSGSSAKPLKPASMMRPPADGAMQARWMAQAVPKPGCDLITCDILWPNFPKVLGFEGIRTVHIQAYIQEKDPVHIPSTFRIIEAAPGTMAPCALRGQLRPCRTMGTSACLNHCTRPTETCESHDSCTVAPQSPQPSRFGAMPGSSRMKSKAHWDKCAHFKETWRGWARKTNQDMARCSKIW